MGVFELAAVVESQLVVGETGLVEVQHAVHDFDSVNLMSRPVFEHLSNQAL